MSVTTNLCPVISKKNLARGIYDIWVLSPQMAEEAKPGQFVNILCASLTLRRPISICDVDKAGGKIRLVFEERGQGTAWLAGINAGDVLDILGPLGNGFLLKPVAGPVVFVGGGIGVPPLLYASKQFGTDATALLGFRSADAVILARDFRQFGADVRLATDDGTAGRHGLVTELLAARLEEGPCSAVFACGPKPMLRAVAGAAADRNVPCFVSLEERMACGVGACLSCACKVVADGREQYLHVCKNGPVFDARKVVWSD